MIYDEGEWKGYWWIGFRRGLGPCELVVMSGEL
jgi:hypothetical protein